MTYQDAFTRLAQYGQEHVLRFWDSLAPTERDTLLGQIDPIDLDLMKRLADEWIHNEPEPEHFSKIEPVPTIPQADP
ncbi:MAG: hypothetical protein IT367_17560, partial [Candidatus Hydrogenedentes bacterium]|nr:hypothetical protein [Candidatus Hydrogenedentota bacterium]